MMMKRLLCAALLALAFASCGKDPDALLPEPTPVGPDTTATAAVDSLRPARHYPIVRHAFLDLHAQLGVTPRARLHGRVKQIRGDFEHYTFVAHFSEQGQLTELISTEGGGEIWRTTFRYNAQGQLETQVQERGSQGHWTNRYYYDHAGNCTMLEAEHVLIGGADTLRGQITLDYDYDLMTCRVVRRSGRSHDLMLDRSSELTFDSAGIVMRSREYDASDQLRHETIQVPPSTLHRYFPMDDASGDESRRDEVWDESGELLREELHVRRLDASGQAAEPWRHMGTASYTYTKDAEGNWTKLVRVNVSSQGETITTVRTREITYY